MKELFIKVGHKILDHGQELILAVMAVFSPVKSVMLTAATLVVLDLITGIMAARKKGEPITSSKLKRSVGKVLLYEVSVCIAFLVERYLTGEIFPASKLVAALIGLTEFSSVAENLSVISGQPLFKALLDKIVTARDNLQDKK